VIELPFTAEVADRNRTGGCSASAIAVRLNAWTVEDDDVECWGVSSRESIQLRLGELGGDQLDVTMSEYETRQLIALLTVHANMEARR
jgi:hypothetical protein